MNVEKLIKKFADNPSYFKKGASFLAETFGVSEEMVREAKTQAREILKKEIVKDFEHSTMSLDDFAKLIGIDTKENLNTSARSLVDKLEESDWEEKIKWVKSKGESRLLVKKNLNTGIDYLKELNDFLDSYFKGRAFNWSYEPLTQDKPDLCMVLCLFDVHIGRESYKHYTNDETNLQQQQREFVDAINGLIGNTPSNKIEKFILPIGNDFFNIDTPQLTTTKGTPQDNTRDLYSMFYTGLNLLSEVALYLSNIAPVELILVPGNHDTVTSGYLSTSLKVLFKDNPRIEVDDSPLNRKYRLYGKTTIGFAHGELKMEKYAELLPYEAKEMFSQSEWYEFLLGDKHHEKMVQKEEGVVVRHLGGMTKSDVWTYANGYTTSKRRAYGILYSKDKGRIMEIIHQL